MLGYISDRWVKLVREFVRGTRKKEENKKAIDYYNNHNNRLLKENEKEGLRIPKKNE